MKEAKGIETADRPKLSQVLIFCYVQWRSVEIRATREALRSRPESSVDPSLDSLRVSKAPLPQLESLKDRMNISSNTQRKKVERR